MYNMKSVAGCLRAKRAERNITRQELSDACGIKKDTLATYEQERTGLSLENTWKLADVRNNFAARMVTQML